MLKSAVILACAAGLACAAIPGTAGSQVNTADLKWGPAPPGSQMAVLSGDPTKPGTFVIRAKMPAGYKIPAHHHPTDEYVTVISGDLTLGMGDKLDPAKGVTLAPGGFVKAEANMNHYAFSQGGGSDQGEADHRRSPVSYS